MEVSIAAKTPSKLCTPTSAQGNATAVGIKTLSLLCAPQNLTFLSQGCRDRLTVCSLHTPEVPST